MTFRAKPVVKRTQRSSWDTRDRRNLYLNVAFGLVVLVAVAILGIAAAATWYDQHLAPIASVNGQSITKDDLNNRARIEAYRLDVAIRRLNTEHAAGRMTDADWEAQVGQVNSSRESIAEIAYEKLIDARVQAALAAREGVTVTAQQVDEQITKEATSPEQRHAWMIEVTPKADADKDPTPAQKAEAKAAADKALADLQAGKAWDVVAKSVTTDSTAADDGDLSWVTADTTSLDANFLAAILKLDVNGTTGVIEGEDGAFRIGRVTEIVPESIDGAYRQQLIDAGITAEAYNAVVRSDLIRTGLEDKIKAAAVAPGLQRRVAEIFIQAPQSATGDPGDEPPAGSVKVRHILYAPKDDPQGAGSLAKDDPAWKKAEEEARAAYAKLKADPTQFDAIARKDSDESGDDVTGGKLPYFDPSMVASDQLDAEFGAAIFKPGLKPGDLLEPVRSAFGWHVIQIMYFPPDIDQAKKLKAEAEGGADWGSLARNFSDASEAAKGGELGWVANYQLDYRLNDAIFGTPVGKVTDPIVVAGDGIHLYKILEEANRTPTGEQKETLEQEAFSNWYEGKKAGFTIKREFDQTGQG